jgi:uncharacterized membrane protein
MDPIAFFVLAVVGLIIGLPIVAIVKAGRAARRFEELLQRLDTVESELRVLKRMSRSAEPAANEAKESEKAWGSVFPQATSPVPSQTTPSTAPERMETPQPSITTIAPIAPSLPPLIESAATVSVRQAEVKPSSPGPLVSPMPEREAKGITAGINWEQFMGVKLFAWVGGLALFLGVAFAVKYSFDQGLISPPVRVALGFLTGLGLVVGGLCLARERYAVTVQALCSAGLLILYSNVFAATSFYHLISGGLAFPLMILVTVTAFLLAVRLNAAAVAVLGLAGGFLTPPLLSTGENRPLALFTYVAILDLGLMAVAFRKRWSYLALMAAAGTIVMQCGWAEKFYSVPEMGTALGVFLFFAWLFPAFFLWARQREQDDKYLMASAVLMPMAMLVFANVLLMDSHLGGGEQPLLLFSCVFAADVALLLIAWFKVELRSIHAVAGGAVYWLLAVWTMDYLKPETLNHALALYLGFAILHSVFPVMAGKYRPAPTPVWWANVFAPLALLLFLAPIFKLASVSMLLWPAVLLVDLVAIALAFVTASVLGLLAVLLLTVLAMGCWVFEAPGEIGNLSGYLIVVGGFGIFFFLAGMFAVKKTIFSNNRLAEHVPALSAILPFLLLMMVVERLPIGDPSPVFGLAGLMMILLLGLAWTGKADMLCLVSLVCVWGVECAWQFRRFHTDHAPIALGWYLGFQAVLTLFPFVFQSRMKGRVLPWMAAALAGPAQFFLVHRLVKAAYPNSYMGLLPAVFAIPALLSLARAAGVGAGGDQHQKSVLALFGGVALFFITLIFPIQFDREWITLGWAVEGMALLWLLHRISHEGLKWAGVGLLTVAFIRLAVNPRVLEYHLRSGTPIFNWYLYAYGVTSLCLFGGAALLAPPRDWLHGSRMPPILKGMGTLLAFWLLNIEIADYFSVGISTRFDFSGNFARDMAYSLGWAVFSLILLVVGISRQTRPARYAGIGLLTFTMLKLFLHDLWSLGGLYRIGSFIGLALVLIVVSFLYQRYLSPTAGEKQPEKLP